MNLAMLPPHMWQPVRDWVERGEPHPTRMGRFLRAVLLNDLRGAVFHADDINRGHLVQWVQFIYGEVPCLAHGSEERLLEWHRRGGLAGYAAERRIG